jgi:Protein of unknown function (DUF2795)
MAQAEFIEIQKYLSGVSYPATKDQLVEHARKNGADDQVIEALSGMPDGEYEGPNRVSSAVAKS